MAEISIEQESAPQERPCTEWHDSVAALFARITAPGHAIKEEDGPEYAVKAVRLRVMVRRSTPYFPRLELHVARKPVPLTPGEIRRWQEANSRLLEEARTIFGVGWTIIEESDAGDSIRRTYIELLAGEKEPGVVPCTCGLRKECTGIPVQCVAEQRTAAKLSMAGLRKPTRPIPELFGGHDQ